jgi:hypothetical protein
MGKTVANLYLEYIENSYDNHPRVLTILSDDIIVEDKIDITENMDFSLSGTTIEVVIESIVNKGMKYRLFFYLITILEAIFSGYGSGSVFKTKVKYVLKLKLTGQEANISVKFDDINTKNPFSIRKSSNVEVVSCGKAKK